MNEQTQNDVTRIAGMEFSEAQIEVMRTHFKEEWQREEIRSAISVITEVLASHNGSQPDDRLDQQISLLLLHGSVQNDIIDRFHHKVPEWNEEALREANEHGTGVWRSLYDIIIPEMKAKLRTGDANAKTYQVNGKTYTENEVIAIYDMWQKIQDYKSASESVDIALDMTGNPDIAGYAHDNDPEIMEQCLKALPDWRVWQDECLSQNCLLLHYLVRDKLMEMYREHVKNDTK